MHAGYLRLQTNTFGTFNTYCFPTAAMIALTRMNVNFIRIFPVLFHYFYAPFLHSRPNKNFKIFIFFNASHQQTFRHPLIECLLLSPQNFDGCVEVSAVDRLSKDDKSAISIGVCYSFIIAEDMEDIGVSVRQVQFFLVNAQLYAKIILNVFIYL